MLLAAVQAAGPGVAAPRVTDAQAVVDGRLEEAVWSQAAQLRGFSQYLPNDGRPAVDTTVVLVWYSPTAIYFGVRAYQDSASVRATLAERDRVDGDDQIVLLLDTFNDRRQAFFFTVNPLGQQADGTAQDISRQVAGLLSATTSGGYGTDFSTDYVFESRGRLTAFGFEVEIRIPFRTLRYGSSDTQDWGFQVIRRVQASGHEHTWAPVLHSDASFLAKSGTLTGLTDLRRGLVLDVTPEVTYAVAGAPDTVGRWDYGEGRTQVGATASWGLTSNLTLNATYRPDFSQIEADVPALQFDPRDALFFPEKRPFFLDGLERYGSPVRLIYTRRLVDPAGAINLNGKVGGTSVALLSGADDADLSLTGSTPWLSALRLRTDLGTGSTLGLILTDREDGDLYNRVAAADGRLVLSSTSTVTFQGGGSATTFSDGARTAPFWYATFNRAGRGLSFNAATRGFHPDFRALSGFISRGNVAYVSARPGYTFQRADSSFIETITTSLYLEGRWDYDRFGWSDPDDAKAHLNLGLSLRGGWGIGGSYLLEYFGYPEELYEGYAIDNGCSFPVVTGPGVLPACALPFTGVPRITNRDWVLNINTPRFQNFSADFNLFYGSDENFDEWAPATIWIGSLDVTWRPTEQLRLNMLYSHQQYVRQTDQSNVRLRQVPRLRVEYQLTRSIVLRVIGLYDAEAVDSLRDDSRTNLPLMTQDAAGSWAHIPATSHHNFAVDVLFSYRPTPGTVLFAGYGTLMEDDAAFKFQGLSRQRDGFFLKLSYQLRTRA